MEDKLFCVVKNSTQNTSNPESLTLLCHIMFVMFVDFPSEPEIRSYNSAISGRGSMGITLGVIFSSSVLIE